MFGKGIVDVSLRWDFLVVGCSVFRGIVGIEEGSEGFGWAGSRLL